MRRLTAILIFIVLLMTAAYALAEAEPAARDFSGYTLIAETETRELWLHKKNLDVIFVDKATGRALHTKETGGQQGNKTVKNLQKSDLFVTYIANEKVGTTGTIDNFSLSVDLKTFEITEVENGFSVRYTIGDTKLTLDNLPKMIPIEKYNEMLLPNWTSANEKLFREHYRIVGDTMFVRARDDGVGMGGMVIKQLYALIFETGTYTYDDLVEDNTAYGHEVTAMNPTVGITLIYQLDGDDLIVTLPAGEIDPISRHNVQMVEILPYFLTAGTEDTGYIFVPDASGSLITLNNGKTMAISYTSRVYGADILKNMHRYTTPRTNITLPVYGIKAGDTAVLAIIEKGAEMAELYADISGRSDEFNRISSRFILRDIEFIPLIGNENVTTPRYPEDIYEGDIVLRYKLLLDEDANYTAMAHAYRDYLMARGDLIPHPVEKEAPFIMDVLGAVRKNKFFLGIPYASSVQATTIAQAGEIYRAAREAGIKNIKMNFSGLFWGGIRNASLTSVELDGGMGSKKELLALQDELAMNGDLLFPSVYMGRVYYSRNFSWRTQAARMLDGDPAFETFFAEPIMISYGIAYPERKFISPHYLLEYTEKALKQLGKWSPMGLSVIDLGNALVPDYKRREHLSRVHAAPVYQAALARLSADMPLMLENPNAYALFAADYIVGLPSDDNDHQVEDIAIPFVQLVLENMVPYSGKPWNDQAYRGMSTLLMEAIETKSAPRFAFTYQPETLFQNIADPDVQKHFATQYTHWMGEAAAAYAEYAAFYDQVLHAKIVLHETIRAGIKRVTYDNGVVVLLNFTDGEVWLSGEKLLPGTYLVKGGE